MRLIVVSNRLPVTISPSGEIRESVGGLATAMKSFLGAVNGGRELGLEEVVWVGWSGVPSERESNDLRERLRGMGLEPVPLSSEEVEGFYEGFSNSTLWPLFHGFSEYATYEEKHWRAYRGVNEKYARAVVALARPGDLVWIHDYHLMLAPAIVREAAEVGVGFFLHIPFPPAELLQLLPSEWRREILEGLLGSDLVGFHTYEYSANFSRSVVRFLGYKVEMGAIAVGHRRVRVGVFPIGIDFDRFYNSSQDPSVVEEMAKLREMLGRAKVVFSIDRLDYTKGVLRRVAAWERFLREHPEWRGRAVFVLVVVPSRTGVPMYEEMKRQIDREVGRINGELGELNWVPIVYLYRFIPSPTLMALYNIADVALITPLRDGMNLVAKEFVASKRDCRGVLILSELAGASKELAEALVINPNDVGGTAEAIAEALSMSEDEQCRRIRAMQERLRMRDVVRWGTDFIYSLISAKSAREEVEKALRYMEELSVDKLKSDFAKAKRRLMLLDYDGTLVPHYPYPHMAVPDGDLLELLSRLAALPETAVYVVSGRGRDFLDGWLGRLPVGLVAEHGFFLKHPGGEWKSLGKVDPSWRQYAKGIMEDFASNVPGSFVEVKEAGIAWHYRNADETIAEKAVVELIDALSNALAGSGLSILRGKKVVEVRPAGYTKGTAAKMLLDELSPDFVFVAGDDETDEGMFEVAPQSAYTVKVGPGPTLAKFRVGDYRGLRSLLEQLRPP